MASQLMQEEKHKKADNEDDVGEEVKYNGEEVKAEDEEPTRGRPPKLFTSSDFDTLNKIQKALLILKAENGYFS